MQRIVLVLGVIVLFCSAASAEVTAQFSAPGVRSPDDPDVNGFRFALFYGEVDSMKGFDLGLVSLNQSKDFEGFSLVFGINQVTGTSTGCLCAFVNVHEGKANGLTAGFVNATRHVDGGVLGMVNFTDGPSNVDVGGLSMTESSNVQVGLVNVTKRIDKVQIGLLNFAENGFMRVFPFFNYPKED